MFNNLIWYVGLASLLLVCAFAWLKGGPAERLASLMILASNLAADAIWAFTYPSFPMAWIFALDLALAMGLLAVALRYSSIWLGAAMLLQSIALFSHGFDLSGEGVNKFDQVVLNNIVSNLMLACIIAGTIASWRARSKRRTNASAGAVLHTSA